MKFLVWYRCLAGFYVLFVLSFLQAGRSHTFFRARPLSQNGVLEHALYAYDLYHKRCCNTDRYANLSVQGSGFYYHSLKNDKRARFFLPHNQRTIKIGLNNRSTISSPWLGIITPPDTPFKSIMRICPQRDAFGVAIKLHSDFGPVCNSYCPWYPWVSVFMPLIHVRHQLNIHEKKKGPDGKKPGFPDALHAFDNRAWNFGRLSNCTLTKTGIDDIAVKLGCDTVRSPDQNFGFYGVFFIPTGSRSKARFLFEPTIGNGRHVGLGAGFNGDYVLCACEDTSVTVLADVRYAYFFKGREVRSIDLINGDWSRYLLVSRTADLEKGIVASFPGINFFTRSVDVTPRGAIDAFFALHYTLCNWNVELGYDLWWRQKEKLCIRPCKRDIAIFDIAGACPPGRTSAHTAKICAAVPGKGAPKSDARVVAFEESDLNSASAAHPEALSHTVYGAASYDFYCCDDFRGMLGLGISYEFSHRRSVQDQFGLWVNVGGCF